MVRIVSGGGDDPGKVLGAHVLDLQREFQARLADETLRYLRSLHGVVGPSSPGTVLRVDGVTAGAEGRPGEVATVQVEVENSQAVHTLATPMLTPLVGADGTTWFPEATVVPGTVLVAPGAVEVVRLAIDVPADLPPGVYSGAIMFVGIRNGLLPVAVTVGGPDRPPGAKQAGTKATPAKKAGGLNKEAPVKKVAGMKKGAPVKKVAGTKKATPVKKAAS